MSYTWVNPYWTVTEGLTLKRGQIMIGESIVQTWPDDDGGAWYYDPETGERKKVAE